MSEERILSEDNRIDIVGLIVDYFRTLRRMWGWVLILAVAGGAVMGARDYLTWSPRYTASATFTVTISENNGDSVSGSYSYYDNSTAEQMVKTFPYILTSGVLSRQAAQKMGRDNLTGQINAFAEENTNLFTLSVTDSDADLAYQSLQAVIECYPPLAEVIVGRTNLEMLDETGIPSHPDNPRRSSKAAAKGAAAGAALGLMWTLAVTFARQTVKKKEDMPEKVHMRCIGEVPLIPVKRRSKDRENKLNILNEKTDSGFAEAIQLIRGKIEYSAWKHHTKIILVTSALAGEGKSTLAVNLALDFAQNGKRTALIDCDLRHPSDRSILGLEDGPGLYEVLLKKEKLTDILITGDKIGLDEASTFFFLPGGEAVEDGSRLLGREYMKKIIQALSEKTDYVILDSAPAGLLTDAGVLAQYADCAVFVVKRDFAKSDHILNGMEELMGSRIYLLGGILNGV